MLWFNVLMTLCCPLFLQLGTYTDGSTATTVQGTNAVTDIAPFVACGGRIDTFLAGTMAEEERVRSFRAILFIPTQFLSVSLQLQDNFVMFELPNVLEAAFKLSSTTTDANTIFEFMKKAVNVGFPACYIVMPLLFVVSVVVVVVSVTQCRFSPLSFCY